MGGGSRHQLQQVKRNETGEKGRGVFVISVLLACIETLSKGYVFRGQGQPVVALETSEALYAMQADPQIASRFEPFALPRWHESATLREFVVSFGRLLPLQKPSPFGDKAMIQKLIVHSG